MRISFFLCWLIAVFISLILSKGITTYPQPLIFMFFYIILIISRLIWMFFKSEEFKTYFTNDAYIYYQLELEVKLYLTIFSFLAILFILTWSISSFLDIDYFIAYEFLTLFMSIVFINRQMELITECIKLKDS